MFNRTSQGIANEHLFYNVEFVVYCEGKITDENTASMDEVFWGRIFELYGRNVKCKSIGSKPSLQQLARFIIKEKTSDVVIVMDRDYDDFRAALIDHPQVIYTYGYSWESDSLSGFDFRLVLSLFGNVANPNKVLVKYNAFAIAQSPRLRRVFALDLKYFDHQRMLFDRKKPVSIIVTKKNCEPAINVKKLLDSAKTLGKFQSVSLSQDTYGRVDGMSRFYGKTMAHFIYHWFVFVTKNIAGSRRVSYLVFMNAIIGTLSIHDLGDPKNLYYKTTIERLE